MDDESVRVRERVGALSHCFDNVVYVFGFGTYVGDFVPFAPASGPLSGIAQDLAIKVPLIVLDSGKVVWGSECWWGPEATVLERLVRYAARGMEQRVLDIDEARRLAAEKTGA